MPLSAHCRCQEDIDDVRREVQIMHHLKVRKAAAVLKHSSRLGQLAATARVSLPSPQGQQSGT